MPILEIKNIKKSFQLDSSNNEIVLQNINFKIEKGTFTVIYGPSGCGKTTLLNLISGLDSHYSGKIKYKEQDLSLLSSKELTIYRKKQIGFVFQNFKLISHMNVLENVLIPMYLNGKGKEENIAKAKEYLEMVDLAPHMSKDVTKLSDGQKQRVAIARALANNPDLIVADEPTGSLDSKSQAKILSILKEITNRGKTVILVTHNQEVKAYADNIIELKDGKLIADTSVSTSIVESSKPLSLSQKSTFKIASGLKISLANFLQRKWRNTMIAMATAVGLTGILIALGLGNGIVNLIENELAEGKIPSQIQVSISSEYGTASLNPKDQDDLLKKIGQENIKYIELPFALSMIGLTIENNEEIDFSETMPNYSQIVSLYKNPSINVVANSDKDVLSGQLYENPLEKGLTITQTLIDDYNELNGVGLTPETILGKKVSLNLVEERSDGPVYGSYETTIQRVVKDEFSDSNSFMSHSELQQVIKANNFNINYSFMLIELHNPEDNEKIVEKIMENKKYLAFSQTDIVNLVINFVKIIQWLLIILSLQAIIVAVVMISVVLYINIIERRKEIGVMKAVGYQNKEINLIFSFEALIITFLSFLLALVIALCLGSLSNYIVNTYYQEITNIFVINLVSIFSTMLLTIIMDLIASAIPMLQVGKVDPAESLRYE